MKKISIVLAILAVFLVFSCSNAAGPVDNAGNPVDLAGSWSGTVASKEDMEAAVSIFTKVNGIDYQGTWVKEAATTKPTKDYDYSYTYTSGSTTVTVTTKYIFNGATSVTTETRVIDATGSYVTTKVEKSEYAARAAIAPVADTTTTRTRYNVDGTTYYYVQDNPDTLAVNDAAWYYVSGATTYYVAEIAQVYAGVDTVTTTTTVTVTKQADGLYTEATVKKVETAKTGERYAAPRNTYPAYTVETYPEENSANLKFSELTFQNTTSANEWRQSVSVPAKKTVKYQNDVAETLTFVVAKDGTYTLTSVIVETQAAADAAAETATHYAAPARKASTLTTTRTTTGTVAAWENPATQFSNASTSMALSAQSEKLEVVGTEDFLGSTAELASVSKLAAGNTFDIRIIKGEGKKGETILTRLYVSALDNEIVILDKAPEAAE